MPFLTREVRFYKHFLATFLASLLFISSSCVVLADSASYSPPDYALDVVRSDGIPVGSFMQVSHDGLDDDWLKCDGSIYDTTKYSELYAQLGTNRVPDLRGRFLRGVDDGKGLDPGRTALSNQGDAIRNIRATMSTPPVRDNPGIRHATGAFVARSWGGGIGPQAEYEAWGRMDRFEFNASNSVPTANENRPVNTAVWIYIKGK